jgi:hypothetical protein
MTTGLLVLALGAIAVGLFVVATRIGQIVPALRALGAYAERLERESAERSDREKPQRTIASLIMSTPPGSESGMKCLIREIFGRTEGDEYFSKHPQDAIRFNWFDEERAGSENRQVSSDNSRM